ncbi:MAG: dihydroxy-acid dehydratase, partial [Exilibacterium sp.]
VLKPSAASPALMNHRGKAVVFENFDHYKERINDPALDIDEHSVMVLKNCGPKGYPGMAEVGNLGLPPKLLKRGIKDMVRISDARMSGTAFGTVVLHVAPEAMELGPLAAVKDGDMIHLDAENGRLHLEVSDSELALRLETLQASKVIASTGGYLEMYRERVLQADEGCDFDFLVGCRGAEVPPHSH